MSYPLRGEVYWVALDPAVGSEIRKTRPCIVLTANTLTRRRNTVVVVPLSSAALRRFPLHVPVPSLGGSSHAIMDQLRAVDKTRLGDFVGTVDVADMEQVTKAASIVLGLIVDIVM